jgi:hypothetical protein
MTPDAFWAAEMQNRRLQQEQEQYNQEALMQGLGMFADAYKQKEQDKSDARIYGNLMKVIAPAFGQSGDAILQEYNANKNDRDKANYGRTMVGSLGAISNMMMAQRNAGIREQGQQIQQNAPMARAAATNAATVAQRGNMIPGARWQRNP